MLHLQLISKVMVMKRDERTWQFRVVGWLGGWVGGAWAGCFQIIRITILTAFGLSAPIIRVGHIFQFVNN
jgi:hypothetical protein